MRTPLFFGVLLVVVAVGCYVDDAVFVGEEGVEYHLGVDSAALRVGNECEHLPTAGLEQVGNGLGFSYRALELGVVLPVAEPGVADNERLLGRAKAG